MLDSREVRSLPELLEHQRRCWRAGAGVEIEVYLRESPALADDAAAVLDLIANEIALREQLGHTLSPDDYAARFPEFADDVRGLFALKDALAAGSPMDTVAVEQTPEPATPKKGRSPPAARPRVAGHEILEYLDGGGQGDVWKARHLLLGRVVALKVLRDGAALDPAQLARFNREGRLFARLDHPHVVRLFDFSEAEGRLYFSMEFAPGGTLKHRLAERGRLPHLEAAALLVRLAGAVQHLHDHGIVHRDLKPSNVLFALDQTPKVADFGLAKCLHEDTFDLTPTHAILGTANYMAPEQAAGRNRDVSPATDVWALGAVLYECLTGRPPFAGETWLETIDLVRFRPVSPPALECPGLPASLERICLKCLEKDAALRYGSAAALADDLQRFLDGRDIAQDADEDQTTVDESQPAVAAPRDPSLPFIPGYEILGILGRGGMGAVYKARQLSLRRIVALKTIVGEGVDAARWRRLRREARLVATLNHTHIVQTYDMGEHGGLVYIAMEFVPGGSLNDALRRLGPPTPRQAAELLEALARAAALIHRRGLVHRDLKPNNILLVPPELLSQAIPEPSSEQIFGTPKITDFGLARRIGRPDEDMPEGGLGDEPREFENVTLATGTIAGTPRYMAPEQAFGQPNDLTPAADVWALGVILYELLAGRSPFTGRSVFEIFMAMKEAAVPSPRSVRADVPEDLATICLRCLQKDHRQRYPTGAELAQDLRAFLSQSPLMTWKPATAAPPPQNVPPPALPAKPEVATAPRPGFWQRLQFWRKG